MTSELDNSPANALRSIEAPARRSEKVAVLNYKHRDAYFLKAKKEGFAARSIYKLEEINDRFRLLRANDVVLDLGCAPGSWSQYASKIVGTQGKVIGIDLTEVKIRLPNAHFIQADFREVNLAEVLASQGIQKSVQVVLSDMAPKTTGIKQTDQARSLELCEMALEAARVHLGSGGHFVCKLFHSNEFASLKEAIKRSFEKFEAVKPDSTRSHSKEIFLVGINKK